MIAKGSEKPRPMIMSDITPTKAQPSKTVSAVSIDPCVAKVAHTTTSATTNSAKGNQIRFNLSTERIFYFRPIKWEPYAAIG